MGNTGTFYLQFSTRSPVWFLIFHCMFFVINFKTWLMGRWHVESVMFICSQNGSPQLLSELNGSYRNVWGSICAAPNLSLVTWEYPFKPQDHTQSPLGHQIQNSQYNDYLRSSYIILLNISSVSDKHFVYHRFRRVPIAWSFCLFIGRSKIANES